MWRRMERQPMWRWWQEKDRETDGTSDPRTSSLNCSVDAWRRDE